MKSRLTTSILAALLLVSTALAEEPKKCSATAHVCEQQIRQMLAGRRYLGLSVVDLHPGIIVKSTVPESPAARSDFQPNDRLIAVNGKPMTEAQVKDFKQVLSQAADTGTLWVIVQRRGAYKKIEVRLEPYPKAQIDKIIAAHLAQSHSAASGAGQ